MTGAIYQWIGSYEIPDHLFIQVGYGVGQGNAFEFFAFNDKGCLTQSQGCSPVGGYPVTCDLASGATPSFEEGYGPQGCLIPITAYNASVGTVATDFELVQSGSNIYFEIFANSTWHTLMTITDPGSVGFQPAYVTQEYSEPANLSPPPPEIWTLVTVDGVNMRADYEFVWHNNLTGGLYYTRSQTSEWDYYQWGGAPPQEPYCTSPTPCANPVCPPLEQYAESAGTYDPYFAGNWGNNPPNCPLNGTVMPPGS